MFNEDYVSKLPHDPLLALNKVLDDYFGELKEIPPNEEQEFIDLCLTAYAIARPLVKKIGSIDVAPLDLSGGQQNAIARIKSYLNEVCGLVTRQVFDLKAASILERYDAILGDSFVYEFSEGDLKRIQKLINELRDVIEDSIDFEPSHKSRLLGRLEKVQSELHKKMADLDRFWGLIGDAGVAIGKFGSNAKPIVDRIREISDIVWRTQARREELPSDAPMGLLTHDDTQ